MTQDDRGLAPLQRLTRMLLDAELAKLNRAAGEVAALRAEIARLASARAARTAAVANVDPDGDLALETGRDALWLEWSAAKRARLAREMAQAAARAEAQRLIAQRAFGRNHALARIASDRAEARRVQMARRAVDAPREPPDGA